jgi:DNA-binding transcriptional MerR regulator
LLTPSQTDPFTGYRYNSASQLPRLNCILAMGDWVFSLTPLENHKDVTIMN